jgi:D-alanine-D-alanine ligase
LNFSNQEVIVEQSIEGREVTCGVYSAKEGIKALPITEIISENEYFDYDAKYNGKSNEVTPAEIDDEMTNKIKTITKKKYSVLGMKGIVRVDYIISKEKTPYVIEVNSIPGMSKESIIPQMIQISGVQMNEILI